MNKQTNNGGPAFPAFVSPVTDIYGNDITSGMTLRDYFAVHATQPGVAEIVTAAGLTCPDGFNVWNGPDTRLGTFTEWWNSMTNEQRFRLSSKVRFQEADAMLTARGDV